MIKKFNEYYRHLIRNPDSNNSRIFKMLSQELIEDEFLRIFEVLNIDYEYNYHITRSTGQTFLKISDQDQEKLRRYFENYNQDDGYIKFYIGGGTVIPGEEVINFELEEELESIKRRIEMSYPVNVLILRAINQGQHPGHYIYIFVKN
jgi:hypothetical protein